MLELEGLTVIAEYFVICSGDSTTQVKAIVDHILESLSKKKIKSIGVEGLSHAHWVLIDYADVVVHVFEEETRAFYGLERLWLDAPRVPVEDK